MKMDTITFEKIKKELLEGTAADFTTTEQEVRRIVEKPVRSFCSSTPFLKGQEKELADDIYIDVRKKIVAQFFDGDRMKSESILRQDYFFIGWINTIASRKMIRIYHKAKKDFEARVDLSEEDWAGLADNGPQGDPLRQLLAREELNEVFNRVLATAFSPHKILVWMEYYMNIYELKLDSVGSIDLICAGCEQTCIGELYLSVLQRVQRHSWFKADPLLLEKMEKKMLRADATGDIYASKPLVKTFGKKAPRAVISDWVYKINEAIRQENIK